VGVAWARAAPKYFGVPLYTCYLLFLQRLKLATLNMVHRLGLPKPIIKSHPEKSGCGLKLGELPKYLGFPLIFLQRLKQATSNLINSLAYHKRSSYYPPTVSNCPDGPSDCQNSLTPCPSSPLSCINGLSNNHKSPPNCHTNL